MSEVEVYYDGWLRRRDPPGSRPAERYLVASLYIRPQIKSEELLAEVMHSDNPDEVRITHIDMGAGYGTTILEVQLTGEPLNDAELALDGIASRIESLHTEPVRSRNWTPKKRNIFHKTFPYRTHPLRSRYD